MKVQSVNYRIVAEWQAEPGVGLPRWTVVENLTGRVVWRARRLGNFKAARTAHAQRELNIPYATARRMGN